MKARNKLGSIILNSILIIYAFVYQLIILDKTLYYADAFSASLIMIVMFVAIILYGFRKDSNTSTKNSVFYKVLYTVILFFVLYFGIGFFVGYAKSPYSLRPSTFFYNIVIPIVIIICTEIYRYVIINNTNREIDKFTVITLIIFEFFIKTRLFALTTLTGVFKIATIELLPIIFKNIVLSRLTRDGGLKSTLLYRLATETYMYIIPLAPSLSDYVNSAIAMLLPLILYSNYRKVLAEKEPRIDVDNNKTTVSDYIVTGVCIMSIVLVSGIFPVTIVGIASNSMYPKITRGDAVVYRKVADEKDLKVGDIIVYKREDNDKTIIHRLVKIENNNGEVLYVTKGDANNGVDPIGVKYKNIKGIVLFKIKFIAYPSIYLSEMKK